MKTRIKIERVAGLALLCLVLLAGAAARADEYVPSIAWEYPNLNPMFATVVPSSVTVNFSGEDPDGATGVPTQVRFLIVSGVAQDGTEINTKARFENYKDELLSWDDPSWSPWMPYSSDAANRKITYPDMPDEEYFLLAIQAMDTLGAVTLDLDYGEEVFNFQVRQGFFRPALTVAEVFLGTAINNQYSSIASGQPLNFSWIADASQYNGEITSYRFGWDLADPDDPNDPRWALPPGISPQHLYAPEIFFNSGQHVFTLRVEDNLGQVALLQWTLAVIPFVDPMFQKPLMLVDQVVDDISAAWPDQSGSPAYDHEDFRNAYWRFLEGAGGVAQFDWEDDRWNHTHVVDLQDMVWYRSVLITARNHSQQLLMNEFRPVNGQDRYVWLAPYQKMGGNVFLVGGRSMNSFLETTGNYMVPIIFDSPEEFAVFGNEFYTIGFGEREYPDGSTVMRGPTMYPYATAGIAALDWSSPVGHFVYGSPIPGTSARTPRCSGMKGMVLDSAFQAQHGIGPGVLADTMLTEALIDWRDLASPDADSLGGEFYFVGDEFVDANISPRVTPIIPQQCEESPTGYCVEPMFRGLSRFDWIKQRRHAEGDDQWPANQYSMNELEYLCGSMALTNPGDPELATARTNGQTYGYLSYKNVEDKPSGKADVYWGFDPYRFDHEQSREAVRWVLEYFGLQLNN
jgi:hypothetical protein